jgi:hypothetical protein
MLKIKKMMLVVLAGSIVGALVGCGPSTKEVAAAHQVDVQQQITAGFVAAKPAGALVLDTSKKVYKSSLVARN